jgi:hypothetical protein
VADKNKIHTRRPRLNPSRNAGQLIDINPPVAGFKEGSEELAFAQWMAVCASVMKRNGVAMEQWSRLKKEFD